MSGADIAVIVVGLLTCTASIIGSILSAKKSKDEMLEKLNETLISVKHDSQIADERFHGELTLMNEQIHNLREEVQKHNNVIERTYQLEKQSELQGLQIKQNSDDIADLKQK